MPDEWTDTAAKASTPAQRKANQHVPNKVYDALNDLKKWCKKKKKIAPKNKSFVGSNDTFIINVKAKVILCSLWNDVSIKDKFYFMNSCWLGSYVFTGFNRLMLQYEPYDSIYGYYILWLTNSI